jgi:hypothetical protein
VYRVTRAIQNSVLYRAYQPSTHLPILLPHAWLDKPSLSSVESINAAPHLMLQNAAKISRSTLCDSAKGRRTLREGFKER